MIRSVFLVFYSLAGLLAAMAESSERIVIDRDIELLHLRDSIYVHVTWHTQGDYGRFPSNGLMVIRNGQALMVDTPMDNDKTERLTRYLKDSMSVDLVKLIIGHFHNDCMGGLEYIQRMGVESVANVLTIEKCRETGLPVPSTPFSGSMVFDFHGEQIDCRYFGAGHSSDNITVYIPGKRVLFGGCLVKAMPSRGLGNLSDAVVSHWESTIEKVIKAYPAVETVIPGHGPYGGAELLSHTIKLVEAQKRQTNE
jgi:metallo-beta-lactamase class B